MQLTEEEFMKLAILEGRGYKIYLNSDQIEGLEYNDGEDIGMDMPEHQRHQFYFTQDRTAETQYLSDFKDSWWQVFEEKEVDWKNIDIKGDSY